MSVKSQLFHSANLTDYLMLRLGLKVYKSHIATFLAVDWSASKKTEDN